MHTRCRRNQSHDGSITSERLQPLRANRAVSPFRRLWFWGWPTNTQHLTKQHETQQSREPSRRWKIIDVVELSLMLLNHCCAPQLSTSVVEDTPPTSACVCVCVFVAGRTPLAKQQTLTVLRWEPTTNLPWRRRRDGDLLTVVAAASAQLADPRSKSPHPTTPSRLRLESRRNWTWRPPLTSEKSSAPARLKCF